MDERANTYEEDHSNMRMTLIRDVTKEECPWLAHDMKQGTYVYTYHKHTHGCIGPGGLPVTLEDDQPPYFELPINALAAPITS